MMAGAMGRILVAGLGNELLSDDGVGVHACRLLAVQAVERGASDVVIAEVGTAIVDAMHLLEEAALVVAIDAMQAGGPPGSVYRAVATDLTGDDVAGAGRLGLHQLGLLGALQMLGLERNWGGRRWQPPVVEVVGVEPATLEAGLSLSPAVAAALPLVVDEVGRRCAAWRARHTS
jgi:hydrogenase maturation protease